MTARAWIELPGEPAWGEIRMASVAAAGLGYVVDEVRSGRQVWLRVAGATLDPGELWEMPPG